MSWSHVNSWNIFFLAFSEWPLAYFTVIWFFLLMLRFRENKFTLVEGSYYEDLHYCFFLTNSIFQKLVINMMGRSIHAIWVIMLDPTCLMVCYAEQRAARSLLGGRASQKAQRLILFLKLTYKQRAITIFWAADGIATLKTFLSFFDQWMWNVSWVLLLRQCSEIIWWE